MDAFLRFPDARRCHDYVDAWLARPGPLFALAVRCVARFRGAGEDVRELLHDGRVTICVDDAAFAYIGVYAKHVSVGFFFGALLPDPTRQLEGSGKRGRHVKRSAADDVDDGLARLIDDAVVDARARLKHAR